MAGEKARRFAARLALGVVALCVLPAASALAAQTTIGGFDTGANRAFAGTRNTAALMDTTNAAAGPGLLTGIHFYASTQAATQLQFFMFAPHVSRDRWA